MPTQAEINLENAHKVPYYKFILTGGPCGGKTTALARVYSFLRERGFQVVTSPETFTILASNGMSSDFFATEGMGGVIQNVVMDTQLCLEASLERVLKAHGKPAVLLCDRGPVDGAAYITEDEWNDLLASRGLDITELRDNRYNAVFHMVTAADGAEPYYTLENNSTRTEPPEMARDLDQKIQKAYLGHPHHYVFDNSTDFEGKLNRLIDRISKIVGLPTNLSKRSAKFLLKSIPDPKSFPDDVAYQTFEVEKIYLIHQDAVDGKEYSFVRKRTTIAKSTGERRGSVYQLTEVKHASNGELIEQKRIITAREYNTVYKTRDLSRHVIRQERISFLYKLQSFTIHKYLTPQEGLCLLHSQVEKHDGSDAPQVDLPPFLDVDRRLDGNDERELGAYKLSIVKEGDA